MKTLFNDGWSFAELPLDADSMFKDGKPVLFSPDDFYEKALEQKYLPVTIPHDWMIGHVKELYKNSAGFYRKTFNLTEEEAGSGSRTALRFDGVYMNCGVWVNGKKAGEWKYGYATFEFDISNFVTEGQNKILVICLYQSPNSRWYSGAGIFRDVSIIKRQKTYLATDGIYFSAKPADSKKLDGQWNVKVSAEVAGNIDGHKVHIIIEDNEGNVLIQNQFPAAPLPVNEEETKYLHQNVPAFGIAPISKVYQEMAVEKPRLWSCENPNFYIVRVQLLDKSGNVIDEVSQNCGFRHFEIDKARGFFLNGIHTKIYGACQHHDLGGLGAAFDINALRRQFIRLKEMGVNAIRTSHNPVPAAYLDLADETGILIDNDGFDMWEKPKTDFDYGNYFNDWAERDCVNWVRKDRNHPSLIMWSVGNEIYDTHMGNGLEITKKLCSYVRKNDPNSNAFITIASNYMMTEGAQNCAKELDLVGYNYLERLYDEHHKKYPAWKIYGSETASTVQSRGIYHFPLSMNLVTHDDRQCSTLGNCTTTWGCESTQRVITNDSGTPFSAGQFIWTGWDYIGEPTPYNNTSKNSYFGQIDTAGFPKDTYFLYKANWGGKKLPPFVHILPYWDWNEGQNIPVKAYSNADSVELFVNGKSQGKQRIKHAWDLEEAEGGNGTGGAKTSTDGTSNTGDTGGIKTATDDTNSTTGDMANQMFGLWNVTYHKGEIKVVAYDDKGNVVAEDLRRTPGDPAKICARPECFNAEGNAIGDIPHIGNLYFIDLLTEDKDGNEVQNARNLVTVEVTGDADFISLDNGDSTDYDEYTAKTRRLFGNRLVAIVRAKSEGATFTFRAASKDLEGSFLFFEDGKLKKTEPLSAEVSEKMIEAAGDYASFVPVRKIEISVTGDSGDGGVSRTDGTCSKAGNRATSERASETCGNVAPARGAAHTNFAAILTKDKKSIKICGKVLPENATCKEINFAPMLPESVLSDAVEVKVESTRTDGTATMANGGTATGGSHTATSCCTAGGTTATMDNGGTATGGSHTATSCCTAESKATTASPAPATPGTTSATLTAICDGAFILRATANNGQDYPEIISELDMAVEGVGNPKFNPYKLVEACRFTNYDKSKERPKNAFTGGISTRGCGDTWVSFDKVDFGLDGSDEITIGAFCWDASWPIKIFDGEPDTPGAECIFDGRFEAQYQYNTYSDRTFTINRRLFGVNTISIWVGIELVWSGFRFTQSPKAFGRLRALDANTIVGDTFKKTNDAVEGIGNNVNLDFANMNFGERKATKLTICGKSNKDNNTINLKWFPEVSPGSGGSGGGNGGSPTANQPSTQVIEFAHTEGYEEKTFDLQPLTGNGKASFVFLPGCNFDFKWFRFE